MRNPRETSDYRHSKPQFAIIAALDEEFSAVRRVMKKVTKSISDEPFKNYICYISNNDGSLIRGNLYQPHDTGRVEAAVLASHILTNQSFKLVLLVGVAGGFRLSDDKYTNDKVGLGDVIFANSIVDTEFQKITDNETEYRDRIVHIEPGLVGEFDEFSRYRRLKKDYGYDGKPTEFRIHVGSVVSMNKIIASRAQQAFLGERVARSSRLGFPLAVEMEAIGVAIAAARLKHRNKFAMLRGISDYADVHKNIDELTWRKAACHNAALIAEDFVKYCALRYNWNTELLSY